MKLLDEAAVIKAITDTLMSMAGQPIRDWRIDECLSSIRALAPRGEENRVAERRSSAATNVFEGGDVGGWRWVDARGYAQAERRTHLDRRKRTRRGGRGK